MTQRLLPVEWRLNWYSPEKGDGFALDQKGGRKEPSIVSLAEKKWGEYSVESRAPVLFRHFIEIERTSAAAYLDFANTYGSR